MFVLNAVLAAILDDSMLHFEWGRGSRKYSVFPCVTRQTFCFSDYICSFGHL